jgi:glycosyltransferase involved in cell wall biosynthesis
VRHLHFTQSLEPLQGGGLGTSTTSLHRQLLAAGIESRLCATFSDEPQSVAESCLEFRRIGPGFLFYSPELKKRAEDLVQDSDVVHGHGLYVGTNYAFGQAARRQGKALVYHVHGMFEPYILSRSRWKKRLVHLLFEDANFRHVRLWRALTDNEAEQIRSCGISAPIVVAPNGLDLDEFVKPQRPADGVRTPWLGNLKKEKFRLLFLGRIHPKKGLDLLLSAWAGLERYHGQWELVIAGPDESGHLAEVRRKARALALDSQARFTGPVTGRAKRDLLHSADLFILPSYSEGFSMGLLEAMACEVPVIATRACNFPQISRNEAGWECDASLWSIMEALEQGLRVDVVERRQRGRNGRRLVEKDYAWPSIIDQLLDACQTHC